MTTIAEKLLAVDAIKTDIAEAIETQGVTIGETDTFADYADRILEITTSVTPTYNLIEYTSSDTWSKPAGLKELIVCVLGAGGGGGSGRVGAAASQRCGGQAGGGGSMALYRFLESELSSSVTITVGAGGTGGAAQTTNSTDGIAGTAGGTTSFGSYISIPGGLAGAGGKTNNGSTPGVITGNLCTPKITPIIIVGAVGGAASRDTNSAAASVYSMAGYAAAGGGGGASIGGSGGNNVYLAGKGSVVYNKDGTASTATMYGANGADNIALQLFKSFGSFLPLPTKGVGASGGGGGNLTTGASSRTANGIAGGNGGLYGAGGGGGCAAEDGYDSGKGGDGAGGLISVIEVFY